MSKQYNSIQELVSDLADEALSKSFTEAKERAKVPRISILRHKVGLSQQELGSRLGWPQTVVSRFENQDIDTIKLGRLEAYVSSLGVKMNVSFADSESFHSAHQMGYEEGWKAAMAHVRELSKQPPAWNDEEVDT